MANILPDNLGENILNLLMGIDAELVHKDSDSHIRIKKDEYSTTISFDDNLQTNTKGHLTLRRRQKLPMSTLKPSISYKRRLTPISCLRSWRSIKLTEMDLN